MRQPCQTFPLAFACARSKHVRGAFFRYRPCHPLLSSWEAMHGKKQCNAHHLLEPSRLTNDFPLYQEGCRCTFISEMNDDFGGDGRGLELEGERLQHTLQSLSDTPPFLLPKPHAPHGVSWDVLSDKLIGCRLQGRVRASPETTDAHTVRRPLRGCSAMGGWALRISSSRRSRTTSTRAPSTLRSS